MVSINIYVELEQISSGYMNRYITLYWTVDLNYYDRATAVYVSQIPKKALDVNMDLSQGDHVFRFATDPSDTGAKYHIVITNRETGQVVADAHRDDRGEVGFNTGGGAPKQVKLYLTVTEHGKVDINGSVYSPGSYTLTYYSGTRLVLTAVPDTGYAFSRWSINGVSVYEPQTAITIQEDTTVIAYFKQNVVTLVVTALTGGYATVNGTIVNENTTKSITVSKDSSVTIRAYPKSGYIFDKWVVNNVNITQNPYTFTANEDKYITAYFKEQQVNVNLYLTISAGGSVQVNTTTYAPGSYTLTYPVGTSKTLTANPQSGYSFSHWLINGQMNTQNPVTVTLNNHTTVSAYFQENPSVYALTVTSQTGGTVAVNGTTVNEGATTTVYKQSGTQVTLTANPKSGYIFSKWTVNDAPVMQNPYTLTVDGNKTIVAYFIAQNTSVTVKVTVSNGGDVTVDGQAVPENSTRTLTFTTGAKITLTANPKSGYKFKAWTVTSPPTYQEAYYTENPLMITATADMTVLASFTEDREEKGKSETDEGFSEIAEEMKETMKKMFKEVMMPMMIMIVMMNMMVSMASAMGRMFA